MKNQLVPKDVWLELSRFIKNNHPKAICVTVPKKDGVMVCGGNTVLNIVHNFYEGWMFCKEHYNISD